MDERVRFVARLLDGEKYLASAAARLTWIGSQGLELFGRELPPLSDFKEVYRSDRMRINPFAGAEPGVIPEVVPLVRLYEVRDPSGSQR